MLVYRRWIALLALWLLAVLPLRAGKDPEWIEGRSPHFHVFSNAKPKEVEQLTQKMEEFRIVIGAIFPKLRLDPPVPTTVVLFKNTKSLGPYIPFTPEGKPKTLAGYFLRSRERMYLVVDLSAYNSHEVAFHEYFHLLLALNMESIPVWLNEGLAMFVERTQIDGAHFTLGNAQEGYWDLLQKSKLIPLDTLVAVDHNSPYYNLPNKQRLFYGESWALVHYFMVAEKAQRQTQLARFIDLLRSGLPQAEAFQQAFGEDYASMQRRLQQYVAQYIMNAFVGKLRTAPEKAAVEFQTMESLRAEAQLTDLWINSGRLDEAEAALKKLAAAGGAVADVQFRLGRIALNRQQPGEAAEHFRAALAGQPEDIALRYYTALALSLDRFNGGGTEGAVEGADEIVQLLSPLLDQKTDFPDAYDLLVQARLARNDPPEELIPLLERVRELLPQKRDFDLLLADAYMRTERLDDAEKLLQQRVQSSSRESDVLQAKEWLQRIREMREWTARRQQVQAAQPPASEEPPRREVHPVRPSRLTDPTEPPPAAPPAAPPRVEYLRGTLLNVACSGDAAVITVQPERKKKELAGEPVHLAVRSLEKLLIIDSTDSGKKLGCDAAGVPVGINYFFQPEGPSLAGVVMTLEFLRSLN